MYAIKTLAGYYRQADGRVMTFVYEEHAEKRANTLSTYSKVVEYKVKEVAA